MANCIPKGSKINGNGFLYNLTFVLRISNLNNEDEDARLDRSSEFSIDARSRAESK